MKDIDKYSELIAKFLAGDSSLAEKEKLFAWTSAEEEHQEFFEQMEQVWNMAEGADTSPFEADMDAAWSKIDNETSSAVSESAKDFDRSATKIIPLSKRIVRWSVAAAILLLVGAGLRWLAQGSDSPTYVEIETHENEKKEILLPDGSQIWLNENSKIVYDEKFVERKIELAGEAFFEVEHLDKKPFEIISGGATTTVLGTSFNVRAYPKEEKIEVTVETGTVALATTNNTAAPVKLPAGTSGVVYKKEKRVEMVEDKISNATSWKTMHLTFDETLIKDVITTLERFFGTEIQVSNEMIYECTLNSTFDNPDLNEILDVIGASIEVDIQKNHETYLLVGKGCRPDN